MPTPTSVKPSSRKREIHTSEIKIDQEDPIIEEQGRHDEPDKVIGELYAAYRIDPAKYPNLTPDYFAALAFAEEPVTVMFTSGHERFAAQFVDCSVQGRGIEILLEGLGWVEVHQVPVNKEVTMKRKYVEVFARCRHIDVKAFSEGIPRAGEQPVNKILRETNLKHPFSIIEDKNPIGREWLTRIVTGRA